MLTCKDFLNELSDYLDENLDAELRAKLTPRSDSILGSSRCYSGRLMAA